MMLTSGFMGCSAWFAHGSDGKFQSVDQSTLLYWQLIHNHHHRCLSLANRKVKYYRGIKDLHTVATSISLSPAGRLYGQIVDNHRATQMIHPIMKVTVCFPFIKAHGWGLLTPEK
jgi:hypothetical protein